MWDPSGERSHSLPCSPCDGELLDTEQCLAQSRTLAPLLLVPEGGCLASAAYFHKKNVWGLSKTPSLLGLFSLGTCPPWQKGLRRGGARRGMLPSTSAAWNLQVAWKGTALCTWQFLKTGQKKPYSFVSCKHLPLLSGLLEVGGEWPQVNLQGLHPRQPSRPAIWMHWDGALVQLSAGTSQLPIFIDFLKNPAFLAESPSGLLRI